MIVTIIEKELLYHQSSVHHLRNEGYEVELFDSVEDANKMSRGEICLLSTEFSSSQIERFIQTQQHKPIILLTSHDNYEMLNLYISMGAKEYMLKPLNSDLLLHKIRHYEHFIDLKQKHHLYKNYHEYILKDVDIKTYITEIEFPMIIVTNNIGFVDQLVLAYANKKQMSMFYISLHNPDWYDKIHAASQYDKLYISGLENLGIKEQNQLFKILEGRVFILSSFITVSKPYKTIEVSTNNICVQEDGILSIADYALMIIKALQFKYPDVKIAEKLGYSRKKVAALRKKFNLTRTQRVRA